MIRRTLTLLRTAVLTATIDEPQVPQLSSSQWNSLPVEVRDAFHHLADFLKVTEPRPRRIARLTTGGMELVVAPPPPPFIVHFLRYGFTLCHMPGVPAEWPEHHRFVSLDTDRALITCARCRAEANRRRRRR